MVATVALVVWAANLPIGLTLLRRWPSPPAQAYVHLTTATVGLAGWIAYVVADQPGWLGWGILAWLLLANYPLGDMLMLAGWRSRTGPPGRTGARAYLAAAWDVLSTRRLLPIAHGVLAPTILVLVVIAVLRG
jgi:hypothetical protein